MEPTDEVLGKSKVPSRNVANTLEGLTVFGHKEIDLMLGHALEYESGDIFCVVAIGYDRPVGLRPVMSKVGLERLSDKVTGNRPVQQVRAMIASGKMQYKPARNDLRPCRKVYLTDDELWFMIVDTPDDIDVLRIPKEKIEQL